MWDLINNQVCRNKKIKFIFLEKNSWNHHIIQTLPYSHIDIQITYRILLLTNKKCKSLRMHDFFFVRFCIKVNEREEQCRKVFFSWEKKTVLLCKDFPHINIILEEKYSVPNLNNSFRNLLKLRQNVMKIFTKADLQWFTAKNMYIFESAILNKIEILVS